MKKVIGFRLDEKKSIETVMFQPIISNSFTRMYSLPPRMVDRRFTDNFSTKELGDLFIELGNKLKEEKLDITNLELISKFYESIYDMGKTFEVELQYDIAKR